MKKIVLLLVAFSLFSCEKDTATPETVASVSQRFNNNGIYNVEQGCLSIETTTVTITDDQYIEINALGTSFIEEDSTFTNGYISGKILNSDTIQLRFYNCNFKLGKI